MSNGFHWSDCIFLTYRSFRVPLIQWLLLPYYLSHDPYKYEEQSECKKCFLGRTIRIRQSINKNCRLEKASYLPFSLYILPERVVTVSCCCLKCHKSCRCYIKVIAWLDCPWIWWECDDMAWDSAIWLRQYFVWEDIPLLDSEHRLETKGIFIYVFGLPRQFVGNLVYNLCWCFKEPAGLNLQGFKAKWANIHYNFNRERGYQLSWNIEDT